MQLLLLAQAIERVTNQVARLQAEQNSLAGSLGELQIQGQALLKRLNELRQAERQASGSYERALLTSEQAENQYTWQESQQKRLSGELDGLQSSLLELEGNKTELDSRIQTNSESGTPVPPC